MNAVILDCGIEAAILDKRKGETPIDGIRYCQGWNDHAGMGISCVGVYEYKIDRYRVFCQDNKDDLAALITGSDVVIGFNSLNFDNRLLKAVWDIEVTEAKTYDLLVEVWKGVGLGPRFQYPSHIGYGLDDLCKANGLPGKSGHGAKAPVDWQQGRIGSVIDYCLRDVWLTKQLLARVIVSGQLKSPKTGRLLDVRHPCSPVPGAA